MAAKTLLARTRHHALAVFGLRPGTQPRAAMLRSGGAIGAGFLAFLVSGQLESAVIYAFFTNFLCLADRARATRTRLWVQLLGGALFVGMGGLGILVADEPALIVVVVFAAALVAGFVHGRTPGLEALPRFGLCCLVVTAFLPVDIRASLLASLAGIAVAAATVLVDGFLRRERKDAFVAQTNASAAWPGPRFSLIYGAAAAVGLLVGTRWGGVRPYWVTITTLLVMQPDRRANTIRVAQRMLGTIAGVVLAFAAVRALPDAVRSTGLVALALALPFLWPLGFERNYGLGTAVLSAWVLILIDTALPNADLVTALFRARLTDTAIGCALALAGSVAVFEVREVEEAPS